jgi:hypothetical protein
VLQDLRDDRRIPCDSPGSRPWPLSRLAILATLSTAKAEPAGKLFRIGVLSPGLAQGSSVEMAALRTGLREVGYAERGVSAKRPAASEAPTLACNLSVVLARQHERIRAWRQRR